MLRARCRPEREELYYDYVLETQGKPPRRAHETRFGGKRQVDIGFEQFAFGIKKRRRVEGAAEDDPQWRQGSNPLVFPYMTRAGGRGSIQLRVPIDDTHTLCILYSCYRPDDGLPVPPQSMIPVYDVPLYNADGDLKTDWITGQDIMAWLMQGPIMDRTTERLGASDRGVIYYRQLLFEQIERVREGEDPLGVMRNPEDDRLIELKPDDERGPAESVRYMDNHWHQFSPIYEEAKALMLRHRNAAVTVQAGGAG